MSNNRIFTRVSLSAALSFSASAFEQRVQVYVYILVVSIVFSMIAQRTSAIAYIL